MWTQAYGGVVTNVCWFPSITMAFMPRSVVGLLAGEPERRFTEGPITASPAQFTFDAMSVLVIGYIPFVLIGILLMSYWTLSGTQGRRHRVEWHRKIPDLYLRGEPDGGWENLDEDLKEVYLEAGYDPTAENDQSSESTDESSAIEEFPGDLEQ